MFDNIPERAADNIRGLREVVDPGRRDAIYYGAAMAVVYEYVGALATRKWIGTFLPQRLTIGQDEAEHVRLCLIAETLFSLRSMPGFVDLCRRLGRKRANSAFAEMYAAKMLLGAGFTIHARRELNVRKEDFDFWGTRETERVNVEVTALTNPEYSEKNVLNALNNKRKQLPDGSPAIIFCMIPETWRNTDWNFALFYLACRFFAQPRSDRINLVVFFGERHLQTERGPFGLATMYSPHWNANPRCKMNDLNLNSRVEDAIDVFQTSDRLDNQLQSTSEFYRWIDHLVPAP